MENNKFILIISAIIISAGIFGAGYSIGNSLYLSHLLNRTVTVKGLAEQDVVSDLGIWEINYREIGNDLAQLNQRLNHDQDIVTAFIKQQGFVDLEISRSMLKVEDRLANVYQQNNTSSTNDQRYVITGGIRVRSANVNLIAKTAQLTDQLLKAGIQLAFDASTLSPNPSFYYTKLDTIRPAMLAQATKSARTVAEQFAKDSNSELGNIQRANQGQFQIMSRDTSTASADWGSNENAMGSINKKVRLVTTIDYRLK